MLLEKSTVQEICDLSNYYLPEIRFQNCIMHEQVRLTSNYCSILSFLKSNYKRDLQIWWLQNFLRSICYLPFFKCLVFYKETS
jgi:hypothetical protein